MWKCLGKFNRGAAAFRMSCRGLIKYPGRQLWQSLGLMVNCTPKEIIVTLKWSEAVMGKQRVCIWEYIEFSEWCYRYLSTVFKTLFIYSTYKDVSFSLIFKIAFLFLILAVLLNHVPWGFSQLSFIGSCSDFSSHLPITLSGFLLHAVSISHSLRSLAGFVAAY